MDSITQKEFDRRFAEYVKDKDLNKDNKLELLIEFVKILKEQGLTICAGELSQNG